MDGLNLYRVEGALNALDIVDFWHLRPHHRVPLAGWAALYAVITAFRHKAKAAAEMVSTFTVAASALEAVTR
jgi:hypothetical protein